MTYRDNIYHEIVFTDKVQFPLNALFNHEPKKNTSGEPEETFREYLFMHLTRGTGFVEMYLKPRVLSDSDWNVLAEGLKWADEIHPCFARARMFGARPATGEVYGYSGWDGSKGYLSVHNPNRTEAREITVTLDRSLGMVPGDEKMYGVQEYLTTSLFHAEYLRQMLLTQKVNYSKRNPGAVCTRAYLEALRQRVAALDEHHKPEGHLNSLKRFFDFIDKL